MGDPDGFWALWNCYIQKRIRIELKPPAQRSQSENQTLQMIESKFDLQSAIFGGEDTINSSEFNISCPKVPYAYEGGASGRPPAAGTRRPEQQPPRRTNFCPCCSIQ